MNAHGATRLFVAFLIVLTLTWSTGTPVSADFFDSFDSINTTKNPCQESFYTGPIPGELPFLASFANPLGQVGNPRFGVEVVPLPNAAGWQNTDVQVTVRAIACGRYTLGVHSMRWEVTGADRIRRSASSPDAKPFDTTIKPSTPKCFNGISLVECRALKASWDITTEGVTTITIQGITPKQSATEFGPVSPPAPPSPLPSSPPGYNPITMQIDKTPPTVMLDGFRGAPSSAVRTATVTGFDDRSGVADIVCTDSIPGGLTVVGRGATRQLRVSGAGSHLVRCAALDKADNRSAEVAQTVVIPERP